MEAWIGLIGVLAGLLIGGALEARRAAAAFRREKAWEINLERRRRLETLYEALEEVVESYTIWYGQVLYIANTQQPPQNDTGRTKVPWARLQMLVSLYFPDLSNHLNALNETGHALGSEIARTIMESSSDPTNNQALVAGMEVALAKLNTAVESFRTAVVERSNSLSSRALASADAALLD